MSSPLPINQYFTFPSLSCRLALVRFNSTSSRAQPNQSITRSQSDGEQTELESLSLPAAPFLSLTRVWAIILKLNQAA